MFKTKVAESRNKNDMITVSPEILAGMLNCGMKRFVKCFFALLTENFSAWRNGHKTGIVFDDEMCYIFLLINWS